MTAQDGRYVVVRVKNNHEAMTVRDPVRNSTFHVVECDSDDLTNLLDEVGRGDEVRLELRRVGRRGNAWCVVDADPLTEAAGAGVSSGSEDRCVSPADEDEDVPPDDGSEDIASDDETDRIVGC
ncbi:hypothetical protein [Halorubrum sp. CBA1125]|uniref:hypothetical protein n=1 Tax=Halorubrum sp. CBA1125 TaxID=2668072 RepID=UPI0018D23CF4|nr:hypothetical protein [Halorubrum sp. CBA1125]